MFRETFGGGSEDWVGRVSGGDGGELDCKLLATVGGVRVEQQNRIAADSMFAFSGVRFIKMHPEFGKPHCNSDLQNRSLQLIRSC